MKVLFWILLTICAYPYSSFRNRWVNTYESAANVSTGCRICHQRSSGGSPWNAYGWSIREELFSNGYNIEEAFLAVETLDSDKDGSTDIQEINSDTTPGWTDGPNNTFYDGFSVVENQEPPVLGDFDLDPTLNTYAAWIASLYPTQTDEAQVAPEADLNKDGVSNLIAYYLGLSPEAQATARTPKVTQEPEGIVITYARKADVTESTLILERSSSLVEWETILEKEGVSIEVDTDGVSPGVDEIRYTLDEKIIEANLFMRVTILP